MLKSLRAIASAYFWIDEDGPSFTRDEGERKSFSFDMLREALEAAHAAGVASVCPAPAGAQRDREPAGYVAVINDAEQVDRSLTQHCAGERRAAMAARALASEGERITVTSPMGAVSWWLATGPAAAPSVGRLPS